MLFAKLALFACGLAAEEVPPAALDSSQDCHVESWGAWWPCAASCGVGNQVRQRKVIQHAGNRGLQCPILIMRQECNAGPCPVHCEVGTWGEWSLCSKQCGLGTKTRSRKIKTSPTTDGTVCPNLKEEAQCIAKGCPVDCVVGEWTVYGECDVTCGSGTQTRTRQITTYARYGGASCPRVVEGIQCDRGPCPVHCKVTRWGPFTACSKTCGAGTKTRSRTIRTKAENHGSVCPALTETTACRDSNCPIHCKISKWSEWAPCTKTCGKGLTTRSRKIIKNSKFGGKACPQTDGRKFCNTFACPVDCFVGLYTAWSECSLSCGEGGVKRRHRKVIKYSATGGVECPKLIDEIKCSYGACPVHCVVGPFDSWSECTKSCGGGTMKRARFIIQNRKAGGSTCPSLVDEQSCNTHACPVDCKLGEWGEWKPEEREGGNFVRRKQILVATQYGGAACPPAVEHKHHEGYTCKEHDIFGAWSKCTKKCDAGFQYRYKEHLRCANNAVVKYHTKMRQAKHCNVHKCEDAFDDEELARVRVPPISDSDRASMDKLLTKVKSATVLARTTNTKK